MSPLDFAKKHGGRMAMWLSNRLNLSSLSYEQIIAYVDRHIGEYWNWEFAMFPPKPAKMRNYDEDMSDSEKHEPFDLFYFLSTYHMEDK